MIHQKDTLSLHYHPKGTSSYVFNEEENSDSDISIQTQSHRKAPGRSEAVAHGVTLHNYTKPNWTIASLGSGANWVITTTTEPLHQTELGYDAHYLRLLTIP